ncbi:MAG: TlpA family protein disulfide reductase [Acidobacteriaceae bacterium]|nr:TlpA family protein disulfide reductase [Acidobacteriaceae bacterium]
MGREKLKKTFAVVLVAVAFALVAAAQEATLPRKAPELAFTIPGQGQKLLSQYRGKVVALEFILTTCPHCQAASRLMSRLQLEFGPRGFQSLDVAINALDENRTAQQADQLVQNFTTQYQVQFPVGYTTRDQMLSFMGFSIMDRFVVPQLVLIDRAGMIHYQTPPLGDQNAMTENVIRQRIQELLALPPPTSHPVRKVASRKPA